MRTFLEICQRAVQESGVGESSQMTDVGQGPPYGTMAERVRRAWRFIQTVRDDWAWQRRTFTFVMDETTDPPFTPAVLTGDPQGVRDWIVRGVRSERREWSVTDLTPDPPGTDGSLLWQEWDLFRSTYVLNRADRGRPLYFAIDPADRSVWIAPSVEAPGRYRIVGDYIAPTQDLAANDDVPRGLPPDRTEAIMWLAVVYTLENLGGDQRQLEGAKMEYDKVAGSLLLAQTPRVRRARAIV